MLFLRSVVKLANQAKVDGVWWDVLISSVMIGGWDDVDVDMEHVSQSLNSYNNVCDLPEQLHSASRYIVAISVAVTGQDCQQS